MLTLRDADGTRMLTEDDLCEEIRLGEIDRSAEVRTPERSFHMLGESTYAPIFSETETIFARRLRAMIAAYRARMPGVRLVWMSTSKVVFNRLKEGHRSYYGHNHLEQYNALTMQVARSEGLRVFNLYSASDAAWAMAGDGYHVRFEAKGEMLLRSALSDVCDELAMA